MPWCPECGVEYRDGFTRCSECGVALVAAPPPPHAAPRPAGNEVVPEPDWLTVGVFTTGEEARVACGYLKAQGVAAVAIDTQTHDPELSVGVLDEWLIKVAPRDVAAAASLLAEAERGRALLPEGGDAQPGKPGGTSR